MAQAKSYIHEKADIPTSKNSANHPKTMDE